MTDTIAVPRNLVDVIDKMLVAAPDLDVHLQLIRRSSLFAAPEAQSMWWNQAAIALNNHAMGHAKAGELMKIFGGQV